MGGVLCGVCVVLAGKPPIFNYHLSISLVKTLPDCGVSQFPAPRLTYTSHMGLDVCAGDKPILLSLLYWFVCRWFCKKIDWSWGFVSRVVAVGFCDSGGGQESRLKGDSGRWCFVVGCSPSFW